MSRSQALLCPCCSGKIYSVCCQPFHQGQIPESAEQVMRSRYAAYALSLPGYIMETTHPLNPSFCTDKMAWERDILFFCGHTTFKKLEIIDVQQLDRTATVTFFAQLSQQGRDASFTEKSTFERVGGRWLYREGVLRPGRSSSL